MHSPLPRKSRGGPPGDSVPVFMGGPGVNASGTADPDARIEVGARVAVDCRAYDLSAATSNLAGWWYHISDGVYSGYWTPASDFENRSGPYPATGGLGDPAVPEC